MIIKFKIAIRELIKTPKMFDFSNFKFLKTIGVGTFGRVYLVQLVNQYITQPKFYALKVLPKFEIIRLRQCDHFRNEKCLLALCKKNPFIVDLLYATNIDDYFVMLMEYVPGGELFSWIKKFKSFDTSTVQFYGAQICLALEFLHSRGIIYRDLKPENLLLNADGYIKFTDFGFSKQTEISFTFCGTPEYMAPEQLVQCTNEGHGKEVDYWSLGIILYEMYVGAPPFYGRDVFSIYDRILNNEVYFPEGFDSTLKDLIFRLTHKDKAKRLGARTGVNEIMEHDFFKNVDWDGIYRKEVKEPFPILLKNKWDTSHFIDYSEDVEKETKLENPNKYFRLFPM